MRYQTELVKGHIVSLQDSSPTPISEAVDRLVKGATEIIHMAVLLKVEVKELQAANAIKKRRQRKAKKRLQESGVLTVQEGQDIAQQGAVEEQIRMEMRQSQGAQRRCGLCGKVGHNARTCAKHQGTSTQ